MCGSRHRTKKTDFIKKSTDNETILLFIYDLPASGYYCMSYSNYAVMELLQNRADYGYIQ